MDRVELKSQNDENLAELFRSGNEDAFIILLSRYSKLIMKLASSFRATSLHTTEDYHQEGLIEFLSAVKSYDEKKGMSFRNYSMMLVKQAMQRIYRDANSKKRNDSPVFSIEELTELPSSQFSFEEDVVTSQYIAEKILNLSGFESKVLNELIMGYSRIEIAYRLECDVRKVDNAIQRIRKKLTD